MDMVTQAIPHTGYLIHVYRVNSIKFTVYDLCVYAVSHLQPSVNDPAGDTIFHPALGTLLCWACMALFTMCCGMLVDTSVDMC